MIDTRTERGFRIVMVAVVALSTALFLVFVYAYPKIFPYIEKTDPQNYRQDIADALAQRDTGAALRSARLAASWLRAEPDAQAAYGELLLDSDATTEAREQFDKAVAISMTPAPDSHPTRVPYFHPRSRMALGELAWKEGDAGGALAQFELAHALENLADPSYTRYHESAAQTYANAGVWSRALEFQHPTPEILASLDREALIALIHAAEGAQAWAVLAHAGRALLANDTGDPSGHYAVGRAMVAEANHGDAVEPLRNAADDGHPDAPYFLGVVHQALGDSTAAIASYRTTPPESLYRAFALAAALSLLPASGDAGPADALGAELERAIENCCPIPLLQTPAMPGVLHATPASIQFAAPCVVATRMPVVVRWRQDSMSATAPQPALVAEALSASLTLSHGADILHLQWVENHFPLGDFDRCEIASRNPPGWIDPAVAWAKSREPAAGIIEASPLGPGCVLSISSESPERSASLYGVPLALVQGSVYAFAARMRAPNAHARLGWEFIGESDTVVAQGNIVNQALVPEWSWLAAVTQAQFPWKMTQVVLGVDHAAGTALFDDVVLLELAIPEHE